ncbi:MAG: response regulator [Candidatus Eremiobacteraeota bacterium]|nr:response regulator [Candidatus Eremiobacteraeota bacterium]
MTHHILIVEDNASIARIWQLKLVKEGYEVTHAKTGKEGLDRVKEKKPSLILMDIMMPGDLDGVEVFRQLRQNVETADIPVIFLSSSVKDKQEIQKILDMGALDFMAKFQITPDELAQKIKVHLAGA